MSVYLDGVRFTAAMVVFLGHVSGTRLTGGFLWQLEQFTGDAVIVFFVLSGFVIGYVAHNRENDPKSFAIARSARIYSVALPAVAATFVLDAIGRYLRPDLYSAIWGYHATGQIGQAVASLTFLNQIWFLNIAPGSDLSYWSLGYEVWYYVIFGLLIFLPDKWGLFAVFAGLALVGPAVSALFPVWLIGLATYRICISHVLRERSAAGWVLFLGSMALWWALHMAFARHRVLPSVFLRRIDMAQDYSTALLFAAHLIGFHAICPLVEGQFARVRTLIRWAAGATFTLYLVHLPVAQLLAAASPWPSASWENRLLVFGGTLVAVFAFAQFTERKKESWRSAIGWLFDLVPRYIRI